MDRMQFDEKGGLLGTNLQIPEVEQYEGKTSDMYPLPAGYQTRSGVKFTENNSPVLRVFCDRVSGNNQRFTPAIPGQGRLLADLLRFWSIKIEAMGIPTHFIADGDIESIFGAEDWYSPELAGRSVLCKKVKIVGVENIAREHMRDVGSGRKQYLKDGTICGIAIPPGINPGELLPGGPLWTPTYKSDKDPWIVKEKVIEEFGAEMAETLERNAIHLQLAVNEIVNPLGLLMPDHKTEWGLDSSGKLLLADEYFSPHAATFWILEDLKEGKITSLDKDPIRIWSDKHPGETVLSQDVIDRMVWVYTTIREKILGKAA